MVKCLSLASEYKSSCSEQTTYILEPLVFKLGNEMKLSEESETYKALSNRDRLKLLLLMRENRKAFTFTDIQKALKLQKASVTLHVKSLLKAGLIANIYERKIQSNPRAYSYYTLTSYGAFALDFHKQLQQKKSAPTQTKHMPVPLIAT